MQLAVMLHMGAVWMEAAARPANLAGRTCMEVHIVHWWALYKSFKLFYSLSSRIAAFPPEPNSGPALCCKTAMTFWWKPFYCTNMIYTMGLLLHDFHTLLRSARSSKSFAMLRALFSLHI
jgi:hypothetical protein